MQQAIIPTSPLVRHLVQLSPTTIMALTASQASQASLHLQVELMYRTRRSGVKQVSSMVVDLLEGILTHELSNQLTYKHKCRVSCILLQWLFRTLQTTISQSLNL